MPLNKWTQDEAFLKELISCVCQKCAADPKFDETKLKTFLDFSDFLPYTELRKHITRFDQHPNGHVSPKLVPFRDATFRHHPTFRPPR